MAEHTPGPWTYDDAPGRGLQIYGNPGPMKGGPWSPTGGGPVGVWGLVESPAPITIGYERWVQFEPEGWSEMQKANARLIAAAPDLLEACKTIVQLGKSRYHDLGIDRMVEAAIAKAEGVQPG